MSKRNHPLTPASSRSGAALGGLWFGLLATVTAFLVLFTVAPASYWSTRAQVEAPFDVAALMRLINLSHHAAAPVLDLGGPVSDRLAALAVYFFSWLGYPWALGRSFLTTMINIDMTIQLPLRLIGAICTAVIPSPFCVP